MMPYVSVIGLVCYVLVNKIRDPDNWQNVALEMVKILGCYAGMIN